MTTPSPSPLHILRGHQYPVTALFISPDNERVYSGDAKGRVVITSTRSLRAIVNWAAHKDSILGVEEFGNLVITHGRDNKIHVWERPIESVSIRRGGAASLTDQPPPSCHYSLDVNALNYCRFSLLPITNSGSENATETAALIAVPNLVESALADVWTLPERTRLHAAIGDPIDVSTTKFSDGRSGSKTGIIMAMQLYYAPATAPSTSKTQRDLRLLCAYEDGGVILRRRTSPEDKRTVEGQGWEVVWKCKQHVESVMAMAVSKDYSFALTVSADHLIGKYDLNALAQSEGDQSARSFRTKHPGNASIAIREDGRVCAVGGWDGRIRLYSTKSLKPLGTLVCHKDNCQAVVFASSYEHVVGVDGASDDDDDMTNDEKRKRARWLIAGGKDNRVSIWGLISFER